jgi:hypothetical protein
MNIIWKKQGKYLRSWLNKNDQNPRHFKFLQMKNVMDNFTNKRKNKNPSERESERKNFTPKVPGEEYPE